jgi:hypothetical protein
MKANLILKAELVKQDKKIEDCAKAIQMPVYTLRRKINGHFAFNEEEIKRICLFLNKTPNEIFFTDIVAVIATKAS